MMLLTTRLRIDAERQAAHPRQSRCLAQPVHPPSARQVRRQADPFGRNLERSRRRSGGAVWALPQGRGKRAAQDLHGDERSGSQPRRAAGAAAQSTAWRASTAASARSTPSSTTRPSRDKTIYPVSRYGRGHRARFSDPLLRADTAGTMQALVGLWQIFCAPGQPSRPRRPTGRSRLWSLRLDSEEQPGAVRCRPRRRQDFFCGGHRARRNTHRRTGSSTCLPVPPMPLTPMRTPRSSQDMIRILEAQRVLSAEHALRTRRQSRIVWQGRKAQHGAGQPAWRRESAKFSFRARAVRRREERPRLRLLDREAHRRSSAG